jgi:alanine racemase
MDDRSSHAQQRGNSVHFGHREASLLRARSDFSVDTPTPSEDPRHPRQFRATKVHVDFSTIEKNVKVIRELVAPAKVAVVVKGNAYGHGMSMVSQELQKMDVDMLCVSNAESVLTLRKRGVTLPILVLSEVPRDAIGPCYIHDATFTLYSIDAIKAVAAYATKDQPAHVHVKVDTGMNRLGCKPSEALTLARYIDQHESLVFEGIFTHFATADDPGHPGTSQQLQLFERVLDDLEMAGLTPPLIHAANSAAAISYPSSRFSMVRTGLAAYGIYPEPRMRDAIDLVPALSFLTEVAFVKNISEGESVSYGWRWTAEHDTRIATLPVGYSDGVPRNLGLAGGQVIINAVRCPIVGAVTMDMMMVDIGNLSVNVGDKVTLIGQDGNESISPTEWADLTGSIPYEMICRLGERLPRHYD